MSLKEWIQLQCALRGPEPIASGPSESETPSIADLIKLIAAIGSVLNLEGEGGLVGTANSQISPMDPRR